jgi:hypothetical protein
MLILDIVRCVGYVSFTRYVGCCTYFSPEEMASITQALFLIGGSGGY